MWVETQQLKDKITGEVVKYLDIFFDCKMKALVCIVEKENGETITSLHPLQDFTEIRDTKGEIIL